MSQSTTSNQAPLLDGRLRSQALATVHAIAGHPNQREADVANPSLARGQAGMALLHVQLARTDASSDAIHIAQAQLDAALDGLAEQILGPALFGGFAGVAWSFAHARRIGFLEGNDDDFADIDAAVIEALDSPVWPHHYDLVSGLTGIAVYALERLPSSAAETILCQIVRHLVASSDARAGGVTWNTPARLLSAAQRQRYPDGYVDLGVAHGVAGVVAVLGRIVHTGVAGDEAAQLLDAAAHWLLAQRRTATTDGAFGSFVTAGGTMLPARAAWCYGDPGIAAALLVAARAAGRDDWAVVALDVARDAAARPPAACGVVDAGLCHGAAGLAHVFHRIHRMTGDPIARDAAVAWCERTLAMREADGIAGFAAVQPTRDGGVQRVAAAGWLEGAAGIGLALLAAASAAEPEWDRALLLSGSAAGESTDG